MNTFLSVFKCALCARSFATHKWESHSECQRCDCRTPSKRQLGEPLAAHRREVCLSSQLDLQWHCIGSFQLATEGVFVPWKLVIMANEKQAKRN